MGKFLVRMSIAITAIYFVASYLIAQFMGIDILYNSYTLLFELCVVIYTFSEGKYHCKFMKWTALSVLIVDFISHTDYYFNYIPLNYWSLLPLSILCVGIGTSVTLAFRHFYKVNKIKKLRQNNGK